MACVRHQEPIWTKHVFKNHQRLKYKQLKRKLHPNKTSLEHTILTIDELMESPLDIFISFAATFFVCEYTTNELIVNIVHPLFLKDNAEASKEDNPNWNQVMSGPFADK